MMQKVFYIKRILISVFLLFSMVCVQGCIPVLLGTGAVAGYTLTNDAAVGSLDCTYRTLWDGALATINAMRGENIDKNESKGVIKATVSEHKIVVKIDMLTENAQRLKVSARKYLFPKSYFAQTVFMKIVSEVQ